MGISENQNTLEIGEQKRLQKAIATRIYRLSHIDLTKQEMFSRFHREIKSKFNIDSYKDLSRNDLQKAILHIENWTPRETEVTQ